MRNRIGRVDQQRHDDRRWQQFVINSSRIQLGRACNVAARSTKMC
jgi:hypothetical protein